MKLQNRWVCKTSCKAFYREWYGPQADCQVNCIHGLISEAITTHGFDSLRIYNHESEHWMSDESGLCTLYQVMDRVRSKQKVYFLQNSAVKQYTITWITNKGQLKCASCLTRKSCDHTRKVDEIIRARMTERDYEMLRNDRLSTRSNHSQSTAVSFNKRINPKLIHSREQVPVPIFIMTPDDLEDGAVNDDQRQYYEYDQNIRSIKIICPEINICDVCGQS